MLSYMDEKYAKSSPDPSRDYSLANFSDVYELEFFEKRTPALDSAVKDFLAKQLADADYATLLKQLARDIPNGSRETQAEFIVNRYDPWIIGKALREAHTAVISARPSLEQVIGSMQTWTVDAQDDAVIWLERHATVSQLVQVARNTRHSALIPSRNEPLTWHTTYEGNLLLELAGRLPNVLGPQALLQAWNTVLDAAEPRTDDVVSAEKVRAWARTNGLAIGRRGRVSCELVRQYRQALKAEVGMLFREDR